MSEFEKLMKIKKCPEVAHQVREVCLNYFMRLKEHLKI